MQIPSPDAGALPVRVMVLADVRLYREGLSQLLAADDNIQVIGAGPTSCEMLQAVIGARPDVVLVEAGRACNTTIVQRLAERAPETRIVAYALQDEAREGLRCAEAGVAAFLNGEATSEELLGTILGVARGEFRCSPRVSAMLVRWVSVLARGGRNEVSGSQLTRREHAIVKLIDDGLSNKEIASRLGIALPTVKNHVHHILEKLHAARRAQAASLFRRAHMRSLDNDAARSGD